MRLGRYWASFFAATNDPVPVLILISAVIGAIADYRYTKQGGKRARGRDLVTFWSACGAIVILLIIMSMMMRNTEAIGSAAVHVVILMFALWELGRWKTRRNNPLTKLDRSYRN